MKVYEIYWRYLCLECPLFMVDVCRRMGKITKKHSVYWRTMKWRCYWHERSVQRYIKLYGSDPFLDA